MTLPQNCRHVAGTMSKFNRCGLHTPSLRERLVSCLAPPSIDRAPLSVCGWRDGPTTPAPRRCTSKWRKLGSSSPTTSKPGQRVMLSSFRARQKAKLQTETLPLCAKLKAAPGSGANLLRGPTVPQSMGLRRTAAVIATATINKGAVPPLTPSTTFEPSRNHFAATVFWHGAMRNFRGRGFSEYASRISTARRRMPAVERNLE